MNENTCNTASKFPSLGMSIYDAIIDTYVIISTLPISTIHLSIPIKDWYQYSRSCSKAGVSYISSAQSPIKGLSAFFFGNCQHASANSSKYFSTFATDSLTYLTGLFFHAHTPFSSHIFFNLAPKNMSGSPIELGSNLKYLYILQNSLSESWWITITSSTYIRNRHNIQTHPRASPLASSKDLVRKDMEIIPNGACSLPSYSERQVLHSSNHKG